MNLALQRGDPAKLEALAREQAAAYLKFVQTFAELCRARREYEENTEKLYRDYAEKSGFIKHVAGMGLPRLRDELKKLNEEKILSEARQKARAARLRANRVPEGIVGFGEVPPSVRAFVRDAKIWVLKAEIQKRDKFGLMGTIQIKRGNGVKPDGQSGGKGARGE